MARTRQPNQLDAAFFAHSGAARDENLLNLSIVNLIFLQLLDTVGMHPGAIQRSHIGLSNTVAARQ